MKIGEKVKVKGKGNKEFIIIGFTRNKDGIRQIVLKKAEGYDDSIIFVDEEKVPPLSKGELC